jgi:hypothetical protein
MMSLVSLAVAWLLGYCGVQLWLPADTSRSGWTPLLHAALGFGLGSGFTSCLYWLLVAIGAGTLPVVAATELVLLAALVALVRRRRSTAPSDVTAAAPPPFPKWLPGLGLAVMLGLFAAAFFSASDANPQGGWDAFSVWNIRARFLLHTNTWKYAVTTFPIGAHMEYPLLLSSLVARGWIYAASSSPLVPVTIAFAFAVAAVAVLVSALSLIRGTAIGLLSGIVLLANPDLMSQAPSQYADVPLAFFFLAALSLAVLGGESRRPERYLSLAGVFAGFAAWTKNEGILLVVVLAAALLLSIGLSTGWRAAARRSAAFVLGALPGLLLALWFKAALAPPDPLAAQFTLSVGQKLAPSRLFQVAAGFLKRAWELYCFPNPPLVLLAASCGLLRLRPRGQRPVAPLLAVLLVLAGYFAIFVVTNYNLDWLFGSALDRLYLHVWPALVLAAFLILRRPDDFAAISLPTSPPVKAKKAR